MRSSPYSSLAVRLSTSVKSPDIFVPQSEVLPSVSKLQFQDQLMKLDSHKSMGLEDMYSWGTWLMLLSSYSIISEKSWWSEEVSGD